MNPKFESWRYPHFETKRTLEDMQKEMEKLNSDIDVLQNMKLGHSIMNQALNELKYEKRILLREMHEELDRLYG